MKASPISADPCGELKTEMAKSPGALDAQDSDNCLYHLPIFLITFSTLEPSFLSYLSSFSKKRVGIIAGPPSLPITTTIYVHINEA